MQGTMKQRRALVCGTVLLGLVASASGLAQTTYEITIQNLTRNQVITPPLVVVHDADTSLFSVGEPASPELATLAEEGNPMPLMELVETMAGVHDVAAGSGVILPSQSTTVMVESMRGYQHLSVVGMLATTNDSFFAVSGIEVPLPPRLYFPGPRTMTVMAPAYDAGSEANSESCEFVPGPPCGNHVHDSAEAEGFVHISNGIHGIGDLNAADADWRNPVARVTITRLGE